MYTKWYDLKCKWHENFHCLIWKSCREVRKIAVYRFLISFLVPELLTFKDLKNCQKIGTKNARSCILDQRFQNQTQTQAPQIWKAVRRTCERSERRYVEPLAVFDKDSFQHLSNLIDITIKFSRLRIRTVTTLSQPFVKTPALLEYELWWVCPRL